MALAPRVENGQTAEIGRCPYQVFLHISTPNATYFCGGSLLSNEWILTVASCTSNKVVGIVAHLGTTNVYADQPGKVLSYAKEIFIHPEYDMERLKNDVSLIRLNASVAFTANIKPVNLPSSTDGSFVGANVIASGWGHEYWKDLRWAALQIISNEECAQTYGDVVHDSTVLCARGLRQESVCIGDVG